MPYVIRGEEADVQAALGGKARALAALRQAELRIPPWIVLLPDAFDASLTPEQRTALGRAADGAALRALVEQVWPGPAVQNELRDHLARLCPKQELVAVRSSAADEDGSQHSFAGQLDSFLFVRAEDVAGKWRQSGIRGSANAWSLIGRNMA